MLLCHHQTQPCVQASSQYSPLPDVGVHRLGEDGGRGLGDHGVGLKSFYLQEEVGTEGTPNQGHENWGRACLSVSGSLATEGPFRLSPSLCAMYLSLVLQDGVDSGF